MADLDMSIIEMEEANDPFALFQDWLTLASLHEPNDPNAMALATVDETGMPNVRMVLLKDANKAGFVFYTNYESSKGQEILKQGKAALCFHWKSLRRQVRVRGQVEQVTPEEADHYYHSRPEGSQIGAWASQQSRPLECRAILEEKVKNYEKQFDTESIIPRPPYWSGFRLLPQAIEFWHDRPFRLHDRIIFSHNTTTLNWEKQRLYP